MKNFNNWIRSTNTYKDISRDMIENEQGAVNGIMFGAIGFFGSIWLIFDIIKNSGLNILSVPLIALISLATFISVGLILLCFAFLNEKK